MANDFLPFGLSSSNLITQAEFAALSARTAGFSAGIARSNQMNKVWRQSSFMAAVLASAMETLSATDMLDDGNVAAATAKLRSLFSGSRQVITADTTLDQGDAGDLYVSCASSNVALTLPAADAAGGSPIAFRVVRTDTTNNTLTITVAGSNPNTIEGGNSLTIAPNSSALILGDGILSWRRLDTTGALLNIQRFDTPGTFTYTPTPGTRFIIAMGTGGGGGGAGSAITGFNGTSTGICGSGAAGGRGLFRSGFAGATVVIGAGGSAGGNGGNGGNGGTTSLGALISFPGGIGGAASAPASTPLTGGNGNTPAPSGANLFAFRGGSGGQSQALDASSSYGGAGGASIFGPGPAARSVNSAGAAGVSPGSGASGTACFNNGAGLVGAAGAPGLLLIEEYA